MAENKNEERPDLSELLEDMAKASAHLGTPYESCLVGRMCEVVMELARREIEREESLLATTERDDG